MAGRKKNAKTFLHELISVCGRAMLPHGQNPAGGCRLTGAAINGSSRRQAEKISARCQPVRINPFDRKPTCAKIAP
jgi:hypothetical protein